MTQTRSDTEYEVWTLPGTSFTVTYPLGLLHEIDFLVNDGYRRISHGGIEIGGLIFGHSDEKSARMEAFRIIECEHAAGPSFVLSERDLAALRDQIESSKGDLDLEGLAVIGWFVSHTRSALQMNDRESALFDSLFPGPGKITLLIKPERFQPTRFGFLVRGTDGRVHRDATQQAIILPLSTRARGAIEPIAASVPEAAPEPVVEAVPEVASEEAPEPAAEQEPEVVAEAVPAPVIEPVAEQATPEPVEQAPEPTAQLPEPVPETESKLVERPLPAPETRLTKVHRTSSLPSIEEMRRHRSLQSAPAFDARSTHQQITRKMRQEGSRSKTRLGLVLFLAAALGCAVGYWGYLQLPSAIIPLSIRSEPSSLLVSWPADQTRDAVYAAYRVDDGDPVPLSQEDKSAGETEITAVSGNVKIEVIAQHWMRDSRGIVRFVRAAKPEPSVAPTVENAPEPTPPQRPSRKTRGRF